jgi:hypothetical protein
MEYPELHAEPIMELGYSNLYACCTSKPYAKPSTEYSE